MTLFTLRYFLFFFFAEKYALCNYFHSFVFVLYTVNSGRGDPLQGCLYIMARCQSVDFFVNATATVGLRNVIISSYATRRVLVKI